MVVLILAILVTIALPAYRQSVIKANRAIGKLVLLELVARQERFLHTHKRYGTSLAQLGFGEPYFVDGTASPVRSDRAIYQLAFLLEEGVYRGVIAQPVNAQALDRHCANLVYRMPGIRQVTGRYRESPERCW